MPRPVQDEMIRWMNRGNPSSDYKSAVECQNMMASFRKYMADKCNYVDYGSIDLTKKSMKNNVFQAIFTSGASESNCTLIRSTVDAFTFKYNTKPRIVISAVEHKSIIDCATTLLSQNKVYLTIIKPKQNGHIVPADVEFALKSVEPVCLVSIMHANNETGAVNDIYKIGSICKKHNVPFYSDCVQTFGKFPIDLSKVNVDAITASFHKIYGPTGLGIIIWRRNLIDELNIKPLIFGSQNMGQRGGTENIIAVGPSFLALKLTWTNRTQKNNKLAKHKKALIAGINKRMTVINFTNYMNTRQILAAKKRPFVVLLSGEHSLTDMSKTYDSRSKQDYYLPNTIMLSLVKLYGEPFCNMKIRKCLMDNHKIVVSAGSACNTYSVKASHVLYALGVDTYIKKGAIRVSLSDQTTDQDIQLFCAALYDIAKSMAST